MSHKNTIIEAFANIAPSYEEVVDKELNRFWGWSYEGFTKRLYDVTPIYTDDIILDIATGSGNIPNRLVKEGLVGNHVHGLDITLSMLKQAQLRFRKNITQDHIALVCGNAMITPYASESFSLITCGLATHHMSVKQLLEESHRILRKDGRLSIIDAGGTVFWRIPGFKVLLRFAAFLYFSLLEGYSRAWIEADAVSNVRTKEEWNSLLLAIDYKDIKIIELKSKYGWLSTPLIIRAVKG